MTPDGCRHCGDAQRGHGQQYTEGIGFHRWEPPSDRQRMARMLRRRGYQTEPRDGVPMHRAISGLLGEEIVTPREEIEALWREIRSLQGTILLGGGVILVQGAILLWIIAPRTWY